MGTRIVQDALNIMRTGLGRNNSNDPSASDETFLTYLNNFVSLSMPNDLKLFENFSTLSFTIDDTAEPVGVYTFNDVGADEQFINISQEGFISLFDPENESTSWQRLAIYFDPGEFFGFWGINNDDILTEGFPTEVLFYGNQMTFRTKPNDTYLVKIYGYKKLENYDGTASTLDFDWWLRYVAYGAMVDYARDYRYSLEDIKRLEKTFARERSLQLTRTHNERKFSRCKPRF